MSLDTFEQLSVEKYNLIKDVYWVTDYKRKVGFMERYRPGWFEWVFSTIEPPPVPNPNMHWRHPTYEEACERQAAYMTRNDYQKMVDKNHRFDQWHPRFRVPLPESQSA